MQIVSSEYKMVLARRLLQFEESETIAMSKKARALAAEGKPVINLSLGEPDFQTPLHIKEAAKKALDDGYTHYPPVAGYADFRKAIAEKLRRENNILWEAENIVVSTGAKQALANIFLSILNPGDEVIILAPYWTSYSELVKLSEGIPVLVSGMIENGFKVAPQQIEDAITPNTRAIIYSSPSNPTGTVYNESELRAFASIVEQHEQILVISDEIYEHIVFDVPFFSIGSIPSIANRVITVNGFSKGFAMTGWRLGYLAADKQIAQACEKVQSQFTSAASSISQRAGLVAITSDLKPTYEMVDAYRRRRDLVLEKIKMIHGLKNYVPDGAFYLFPDVSAYLGKSYGQYHIHTVQDLCMYLLNEAYVSLVPGSAFGNTQNIRFSFAASEQEIVEAIERMNEAFSKLN